MMAVTIDGDGTITGTGFLPAGLVAPYAGSAAPAGWLLCGGQAVSRTDYAGLFAAISTTYGVGDGSTTFNVPDLRGRTVAGLDNINGTDAGRIDWANTLGTTGGTQTHTLTAAESGVPAHDHSASSNTTGAHTHTNAIYGGSFADGPGPASWYNAFGSGVKENRANSSSGSHSHTITVNNNTAANASSAHNNMQPTMLLNYIIKV